MNHFVTLTLRSAAAALLIAVTTAQAAPATAPLSPAEIDRIVSRTMATFSVPGVAVGVVKDGKLVFAKGYGVRELGKAEAIDADTDFAIGSNSKAFTTAALSILVDEGKLHWDDRVVDYLPDFRMADPYVTREFTIRDLLTHQSGLGLGAGDLLFATPTDFTRADVIHALRYLKPATSFRSRFAYDNTLYVVAGEVIATVSGTSWEDFVTTRLLDPLGMSSCAVASARLRDRGDVASPHEIVDGKLVKVTPLDIPLVGAAGGIQCNLSGMARWVTAQLARGKAPDGSTVFSAEQSEEMWSPQTPLRPSGRLAELTHTHLAAYGLGWGLEDFDGYKRISHNGGLPGMVTHVSLLPELKLGVVVLTNQQDPFALSAIAIPILEAYAGAPRHDWVTLTRDAKAERTQMLHDADRAHAAVPDASFTLSAADADSYIGTYVDPWRGAATVSRNGAGLRLVFSHTHGLAGPLVPIGPGEFVVRWDDRSLNADAYVRFNRDFTGKITGLAMQAESASTDFSYDFRDLDFHRLP